MRITSKRVAQIMLRYTTVMHDERIKYNDISDQPRAKFKSERLPLSSITAKAGDIFGCDVLDVGTEKRETEFQKALKAEGATDEQVKAIVKKLDTAYKTPEDGYFNLTPSTGCYQSNHTDFGKFKKRLERDYEKTAKTYLRFILEHPEKL